MRPSGSILPANPLLVVAAKGRNAVSAASPLSLSTGQTVRLEVLSATAAGEARIRIDRHVLSTSVGRPLPEGATGTAVVKHPGPPILLQLTELSPPPPRDLLRIPMLMGKESLGSGPFPPSALERWNESLLRQYPPDLQTLSPELLRDGILLTRFLSAALSVGMTGGEDSKVRKERPEPEADHTDDLPRGDAPFWFFLPTPGERSPIVFPGHRRREGGEREASWGVFLRLPDFGSVSVRFRSVDAGWNIAFSMEDERLHRAVSAGAAELGGLLRDKGFPVRIVTVGRMPKGRIDAEVAARMSRDIGLPLLERRA